MTTDLVEKCARAVYPDWFGGEYFYEPWQRLRHPLDNYPGQHEQYQASARYIALAVIDALADGVSDEMVRAGEEAFTGLLIPVDSELKAFLAAAIRAAKSREG